jgi:hypothetical protein
MQISTTVLLLLLLLLRLLLVLVVLVLVLLLLLVLVPPLLIQLLQLQPLLLRRQRRRLHLTSRAPPPRTILRVHLSPNVWLPPVPHMIASHAIHWSWRSDDGLVFDPLTPCSGMVRRGHSLPQQGVRPPTTSRLNVTK